MAQNGLNRNTLTRQQNLRGIAGFSNLKNLLSKSTNNRNTASRGRNSQSLPSFLSNIRGSRTTKKPTPTPTPKAEVDEGRANPTPAPKTTTTTEAPQPASLTASDVRQMRNEFSNAYNSNVSMV